MHDYSGSENWKNTTIIKFMGLDQLREIKPERDGKPIAFQFNTHRVKKSGYKG